MRKQYYQAANFVAPAPKQVEIVEVARELPAPPQTVLLPTANYTDRSKGFTIATGPLAGATGVVVLLIGITAFGVPVLSVAALLLALGGFTLAWLIAYLAHVIISPDGATFFHVVFAWRLLHEEARERRQRYREVGRHE